MIKLGAHVHIGYALYKAGGRNGKGDLFLLPITSDGVRDKSRPYQLAGENEVRAITRKEGKNAKSQ